MSRELRKNCFLEGLCRQVVNVYSAPTLTPKFMKSKKFGCCQSKAKSGNLNLILCIFPFFVVKHRENKGKKGKMHRKRFRSPDFASEDYCKKDPCNFNTEMFVSKVGQPLSKSWSCQRGPRENGSICPFRVSSQLYSHFFVKVGQFDVRQHRTIACPNLVAHDCGYPLSPYTCRATRVAADFLDFIAFCRCSTGVALHPLKI